MLRYQGTRDEDHRMLRWYADLVVSGELETTFISALHPAGAFFGYFRSALTLYEPDDSGRFAFIAWAQPFLSGALFGCYVQPRYRRSKSALRWVEQAVALTFQWRDPILAFTRRSRNAQMYVSFGCQIIGKLPGIADGADAYVLRLTQKQFLTRRRTASGRERRRITEVRV